MTSDPVLDPDTLTRRLAESGGPLVDPGSPGHVAATFVWRRPAGVDVRYVHLEANGITDRHRPVESALRRVADSDLWALTLEVPESWRGAYGFLPRTQPITGPAPGRTEWQWWREVLEGIVPDATNPRPTVATMGMRARSEAVMPAAPRQHWWESADSEARGTMRVDTVTLAGVPRTIWTYEPVGLAAVDRPVVILFDGRVTALETPVAPSFDLFAERGYRVPLVVMIDSVSTDLRSVELPCNSDFLAALTDDLLPALRRDRAVTADPRSVLVGGASYGGLAATYAALQAPGHIGGAVSLSGSFWWPRPAVPGASVQDRLASVAVHGSRFRMAAGSLEWRLLSENREVADLLQRKGFDVTYDEFCGGHDYVQWRDLLVAGAADLLGACS